MGLFDLGFEGRAQRHRPDRRFEATSGSGFFDDDLSGGIRIDRRRRQHRGQVGDERHGGRRQRPRRVERSVAGEKRRR